MPLPGWPTTVVDGITNSVSTTLDKITADDKFYFKQGVYGQIPNGGYDDITKFTCTDICSLTVLHSQLTYSAPTEKKCICGESICGRLEE